MTPSFILDENIVILAQQGLDEYGNPNSGCANLIQQIIEICHTLVVDDVLWDKYVEQLYRPGYHHPTLRRRRALRRCNQCRAHAFGDLSVLLEHGVIVEYGGPGRIPVVPSHLDAPQEWDAEVFCQLFAGS